MNKRKKNHLSRILCIVLIMLGSSLLAQAKEVGRWEKLGQKSVNLTVDKDVISCSHKGTFTAIRLHVAKAPVNFLRVVVKYANGTTDNLNFNQLVPAGSNSRYLDLKGNRRVIREVVMYYKSEPRRQGVKHKLRKAEVQVWGRH